MIRWRIEGLFERERVKRLVHIYNDIISIENLLVSWQEFLRGKRKRKDVAGFYLHFMDNIFALHQELADQTYRHGGYQAFKINDPKPRIFIKRAFVIDWFIMLFIVFYIHILIGSLFLTPIPAGSAREHTKQ